MRSAYQIIAILLLVLICPWTAAAQGGSNCSPAEELLLFLKTEQEPSAPLLPSSVKIADGFEPGAGKPAGKVHLLEGTVLVLHKGESVAYRLQAGLPVFNEDTLVTGKASRVTLLMADGSALTLTAQSKLVINQSVVSPGSRDTRLQLLFGRVRAIVMKIKGGNNFTINTPTIIAGVRGTDFALAVGPSQAAPGSPLKTAALTGGDGSTVELAGGAGSPALLGPLSVTEAVSGSSVCPPFEIGIEAVKALRGIAPETEQAAGAASPVWEKNFFQDRARFGLEAAVEKALANDVSPKDILSFVLENRDAFGIHLSLKTLFCAGEARDLIQEIAEQLGIADEEVGTAFAESLQECGSTLVLSDRDVIELPDDKQGDMASPSRP